MDPSRGAKTRYNEQTNIGRSLRRRRGLRILFAEPEISKISVPYRAHMAGTHWPSGLGEVSLLFAKNYCNPIVHGFSGPDLLNVVGTVRIFITTT